MRLKQIIQTDWLVLLLFTILVFLFRLPTFYEFGVSNNGDEGLYLLMARDLLDGKPPYTGVWDNKPIGIYIIYSLALILFGNSVVSIPVIACIAISISCFLLYKFGRLIGDNDPQIGFLAGLLYAIFSTGNDELSANTEIFFVGFTIFSVYQLFQVTSSNSVRRNSIRLFLIGLAMGIALTIKQVVIFEFIAIAIITAIALRFSQPKERRYKLKHLWQIYISLFSGFIIPTALVALYFLASGHFSDYIFANFTANLLRVTGETITVSSLGAGWLTQFKRNLFLFLGLSLAPFYLMAVGKKNSLENRKISYLLGWAFAAILGISSPKSFYPAYFIQLLPSLCLLNAYLIKKIVWTEKVFQKKMAILSLILIAPIFNSLYPQLRLSGKYIYFRNIQGIEDWGNTPAAIAKYLRPRVSDNDYIYVFNYHAVVYYLAQAKVPSKYAFPPFITLKLSKITGKDPARELNRIMTKKPLYVIKATDKIDHANISAIMDDFLRKEYSLEKTFIAIERELPEIRNREIQLYRRVGDEITSK